MRSRIALPVLLLLGGCAGGGTTGVISYGPAEIDDCRKPVRLEQFSVYARQIKWAGQKVTMTFAVKNEGTQPAAFADPTGSGHLAIVLSTLHNTSGSKYEPTGMAAGPMGTVSDRINPGVTKDSVIVFEVPPGEYIFSADRSVTYPSPVGVQETHYEPYSCRIPAI